MSETTKPFCDNCLKGFLLDGQPTGTMSSEKLGGIDSYVALPKTTLPENEGKAIIIAPDFFGLGIPNPKLMADQMAEQTGIAVYVPDVLEGDYPSAERLEPAMIETPINDLPFYKRYFRIGRMIFGMLTVVGPGWFKRHGMDKAVPLTEKFCSDLKKKKGIKRIGIAGYCYGGTIAIKIASFGDGTSVDVVIPIHAGGVTMEEIKAVKQPMLMICSGEDLMFDSMRPEVKKSFEERKAAGETVEFLSYPGTVHGYAARPNLADPIVKEAFEDTGKKTVQWFKDHL